MPRTPWRGVIDAYREYFPLDDNFRIISLYDGNRSLIEAPRLSQLIAPGAGLQLLLKYEGLNPSGSFKDRGITAAVCQALFEGAETVI